MQQASEACPHVRPSTWYYRTNCACAKYGILTPHLFKGKLVGSKKAASNDITLVPNSHSPSHVLVHIKQSKTDPFRQGRTITITKSLSPICSVMAMKDYLLQAQPPSSHPLFAFVQPRHWLTRNNLTTELRTILQHCGLPANNFYPHSFRIGAATTAAKTGLPPWLIKVLGRWKSDCY